MITKYCCVCNSKEELNIHHFIPTCLGGTDNEKNKITLCSKHHNFIHKMERKLNINYLVKLGKQKLLDERQYTGGKIPFGFKLISTGKFKKNNAGIKREIRYIKFNKKSDDYKILKFIKNNKEKYTYYKLQEIIKEKWNKNIQVSFLYKLYSSDTETLKRYENIK